MDLSLSNLAVAENPPWAFQPTTSVDPTAVLVQAKPYGLDFENAIRTKLSSVFATSKSVEFDRQVLLALHDSPLRRAQAELLDATLDGQLFFAIPMAQRFPYNSDLLICRPLSKQVKLRELLRSSYAVEFSQVLLLHLIAFLIDRVADYWNAVAQARTAWKSNLALIAFRQQLKAGLRFKPLHTPSLLIPRSIHPIGSAA